MGERAYGLTAKWLGWLYLILMVLQSARVLVLDVHDSDARIENGRSGSNSVDSRRPPLERSLSTWLSGIRRLVVVT